MKAMAEAVADLHQLNAHLQGLGSQQAYLADCLKLAVSGDRRMLLHQQRELLLEEMQVEREYRTAVRHLARLVCSALQIPVLERRISGALGCPTSTTNLDAVAAWLDQRVQATAALDSVSADELLRRLVDKLRANLPAAACGDVETLAAFTGSDGDTGQWQRQWQ